jgi:hypothetical protein
LVPIVLCLGAFSAGAQTVISVSGTSAGEDNELATTQSSWTQTTTYTGVTIQATLDSCSGVVTGVAYLTMNGTAQSNQIAVNNSVSINPGLGGGDSTATLFSGLTLGPGTYYLTINPTNGECDEIWQNISGTPSVTTGAGVTIGTSGGTGAGHLTAAYPPASTFSDPASFLFSVTGTASSSPTPTPTPTPSPTPAPASVILLGIGLLVLLLWHAWRFRQQSNTL